MLTAVLGVFLLFVVIGVVASDTDTSQQNGSDGTEQASNEVQAGEEPTEAGIGQAARDGKFEFTVNGIECGHSSVGEDFLTEQAQGQFCLLSVAISNIGDKAQSFYAGDQYLLDDSDKRYSANTSATYAASGSSWYDDINPGNRVEGVVVFDIPTNITPLYAQLHDSAFSGGVKVRLQ